MPDKGIAQPLFLKELCQGIAEHASDRIFVLDEDLRFVFANVSAATILGLKPGDLVGRTLWEVFPKEAADRRADIVRQVFRSGESLANNELPVPTVHGLGWVSANLDPVKDADGRVRYVVGIARDVTAHKQAAEDLRKSEERYRALVESQTELVCRFLPDGRVTFVNEALCRYFGRSREEFIGVSFRPCLPEGEGDALFSRLAAITPDNPVVMDEHLLLAAGGEERWVQWTNRGIFDGGGNLVEYQGVGRDVTERRQAESARREIGEKHRALIETTDTGYVICDGVGRVVDANAEYVRLTGHKTIQQILGRKVTEWTAPHDIARNADEVSRCMARGFVRNLMIDYVDREGRITPIEINATVLQTAGGPRIVTLCRDISERKRFQERIVQAQKMEMAGQLAGSLAHDFNNLLTAILGHAGLLESAVEGNEEARESVEIIKQATRRGADLTSRLLGFVRKGAHQNIPVDLGGVVDQVVKLIGPSIEGRVRVTRRYEVERPVVVGDPGHMEQVLMNLALNACDAMPEGGLLDFRIHDYTCERPGQGEGYAGPCVVVSVSDTGCGMSEEMQGHIFEPFFTTKKPDRGAGLGLATVYGIVKNHGGWVQVESKVGRGSTFHVFLPAAPERLAAGPGEPAVQAPDSVRRGTGRVLVVDDDPIVRQVAERVLSGAGFDVVTASSGREAVACYEKPDARLDLVVLDMNMPEMDGLACFDALRTIDPRVRVLLATGYGDDPLAQELINEGLLDLVRKPYDTHSLTEAACRAMNR